MENNSGKDAVIIGSGIGGLTSAIILLKLGYNVTVVEKNREAGGMMRSYRRHGIDCPVGIHYIGSLGSGQPLHRIFNYLGILPGLQLEQMGVEGPVDKYIFDDFTFDLPAGIDNYEESLRSKFPDDNDSITEIMKGIRKVSDMIFSFAFPFGSTENNSAFSFIDLFEPMGNYLSGLNCSKNLRSVLEVPCTWIGVHLHNCPIFLHHNALLSYLFSSWRLKDGGSGMAGILVSQINKLGGRVITGDGVEKIAIEDRIVRGVQLKSGKILNATTVIAAIHPKTMLGILDEDSIKPAYVKRIRSLEDTGGTFSVHYALDAKVNRALPYNIFRLKSDGEGVLSQGGFYQLRSTENPDENILTIITSSNFPEWEEWKDTKSGHRGPDYIHKKEKKAAELLESAVEFFGPVKVIKMLDIYTPLTIRDWVESPNGSTYGILRSKEQLIKTASLNRTSVKGLYLAGQSVLAPGILGTTMGSLMTVRDIIGIESFNREIMSRI